MSTCLKILTLLQDGRFRSGQVLADSLGMSRAAVWKGVETLRDKGVDIQAVSGKGYRLSRPVELLDEDQIRRQIRSEYREHYVIELHEQLASTNQHLLERIKSGTARRDILCLTEYQSAGRGRRGRQWVSPFAANLYLSILLHLQMPPQSVAPFSLVCAISLLESLIDMGVEGVKLKWPNDLIWDNKKLAGILLEMSGEAYGEQRLVVGMGINIDMNDLQASDIDQAWIDLNTISGRRISRNGLVASIVNHLMENLEVYRQSGMNGFIETWHKHDGFIGQRAKLISPGETIEGIVHGIDAHGNILLEDEHGVRSYSSGEMSLRR